jgi:hypothetical protein
VIAAHLGLAASSDLALGRRVVGAGIGVAALLTALLLVETLPYAWRGSDMPFFVEKGAVAREAGWRVAFGVHVGGGLICLLTALPLFSRRLLAGAPLVHRALGWGYVASVLVLLVPGGLALIPFAKGGLAGRSGFLVQALWIFAVTVAGLRRVLARDFVRHRAWMIRSYAMASSALSFRVLFVAFQATGASRAYEMGIWASLGLSVVLGEAWVRSLEPRRIP